MEFRGDDRAVAVQIGAVLLLGFLVISLSMYQATVVPSENERVEFRHNQRVIGDMQQVRNGVLGAAATGASAPTTVELGTNYPARSVFVNPSPPGGTLATSPLGNVTVNNAVADDAETAAADFPETDDFWDDTTREYPTKALTYRPSYNRYQNAPATVYENGLLYNRFGANGTNVVTVTDQSVVSGRRITLVTLTGNVSRGGSGTLSVDPRAVSQSSRTVSVTNASDGSLSVVVPSRMDAAAWNDSLAAAGELDEFGGHVRAVTQVPGRDAVELVFEDGVTYQLRLSRVRVGSGSGDTDAAYLTSVERPDAELRTGDRDEFVVEARDAYNNPVPAAVDASAERGTLTGPVTVEPGRYRFEYTAPNATGEFAVNVSLTDQTDPGFDPADADDVRYAVNVTAASDGGTGGNGPNPDGESNAVVDDYDDQNANEPFPPANPVGTVSAFGQAQTDNNQYAQLNSNAKTLRVGTRTTNVNTAASGYELSVTYAYSSNGDQPVDLRIVDESGDTLQSVTLAVTNSETQRRIDLDADATNAVRSSGTLYVVYENDGSKKSNLRLYYQVLRAQ